MLTNFDDIQKLGKENMDVAMKQFGTVSKGWQAIATEFADYSKKSFEEGSAALEKLLGAKSLEKAIEIQSAYAKSAYETLRGRGDQDGRALYRSRQGNLQAARRHDRQGHAGEVTRRDPNAEDESPADRPGFLFWLPRDSDHLEMRSCERTVPICWKVVIIWLAVVSITNFPSLAQFLNSADSGSPPVFTWMV